MIDKIDSCNAEYLGNYDKLLKTLKRLPSIEPRALSFFVNADMEKEFEEEFLKNFKNDYILMAKKDVTKSDLFGKGNEHYKFRDFIGCHEGLTELEMMVPLIVIECK